VRGLEQSSKNIGIKFENIMTIKNIQEKIISEFKEYKNWDDKYVCLIKLGKNLSSIAEEDKTEDSLINGCDVSTWLISSFRDGKVFYMIDSNSLIVRGLASLLLRVLSGQKPEDVENVDFSFVEKIGLGRDFLASRSDNFWKVVDQMKVSAANYARMPINS
jgi:cysteine desulfuration protein SufE